MEVNLSIGRPTRLEQLIAQFAIERERMSARKLTDAEFQALVEEARQRKPSPLEQMAEERAKARNTAEGGG